MVLSSIPKPERIQKIASSIHWHEQEHDDVDCGDRYDWDQELFHLNYFPLSHSFGLQSSASIWPPCIPSCVAFHYIVHNCISCSVKWLWSGAGDTFHTWSHTDWQPQPRRPEYLIELIPHTMLKLLPASIHWIYHHLRLHMLRSTFFVNKSHTRCSTLLHSFKDMY